jgi:hypothetical protein
MLRAPLSGDLWRVPIIWNHVPAGLERFRGQVRYNIVQRRIEVWSNRRIRLWSNGTDGRVGLWRETRAGVV